MQKLSINQSNFELAFEFGNLEITAYLDTYTGEIIFVEDHQITQLQELLADVSDNKNIESILQIQPNLSKAEYQQLLDIAQIESDTDDRYQMIPNQNSDIGYQNMQEYIFSLKDDHLRELLETAIQGIGAFQRFRDTLYRYPDAQKNWIQFYDECKKQRIIDWFISVGIEPEFI